MIRSLLLALLVALAATLPAAPASAHALEPGYLELRRLVGDSFAVLWRVPGVQGRPMAIRAVLPETCDVRSDDDLLPIGSGFVARWQATCTDGLAGQRVTIDGLAQTSTDVLVRVDHGDGVVEVHRLTPDRASVTLDGVPVWSDVAMAYFALGVEHILVGIDHLLFVLALVLLLGWGWRLLEAITAFTVAHSITLALATLGHVTLPGPPVEAVIALSIVFLACELARGGGRPTLTRRHPWLVAFVFGLIHGLGFAGALEEVGLPRSEIGTALLTFNLGVEAGQVLFVLAVIALGAAAAHLRLPGRAFAGRIAIYGIGTVASLWLIERVSAM